MEKISFEEILKRDGKLCYSVRGTSMLPMLRQDIIYSATFAGESITEVIRAAMNSSG